MQAIVVGAVESTRVAVRSLAMAPGWVLDAVITLPPDLASRHSDFIDLAPDAAAAGAELVHAADSNAPPVIDLVAARRPDMVFVIGWSQICRPAFRAAAADRVIGYHPAPLPRLRGRGVIPWTILLGEPITAGTLFWIDDGVDSGDILAQQFFHVSPDETAATLYARHMAALGEMLGASLAALAAGAAPRTPQDARHATWAARRTPADGRIDWQRPAAEIERLVRAVGHPYPGAVTTARGEPLVVWAGELWPDSPRHAASPGQVIAADADSFVVRCGDGSALRVHHWQGRAPALHSRLGDAR